ncbi:kinase-like domain-containing protein [Sporodiniella umbellata]|nr:kinase-like domain-containing protein [Sporodiniella umbellata]
MQVDDHSRHHYSDKSAMEHMESYWTLERVIQWLKANNFRSAIEMFKAKGIYGRAFLELDSGFLLNLHNDLSLTERNKLVHLIKSIPQVKEHFYLCDQKISTPPLIPERKSSTNEHVLNLVKNIPIPTKLPIGAARNTRLLSNKISIHPPSAGNQSHWKVPVKSNALPEQHYPQQNIHVTTDSDTFHSLQVTGIRDPLLLKSSILKKLGLGSECNQFVFFHENGRYSNVPLSDHELFLICQNSEHSATNRILVRAKSRYYTSYSINGTKYCDFAPINPKKHSVSRYSQNSYSLKNCDQNTITQSGNYKETKRRKMFPSTSQLHPVENANSLWPTQLENQPRSQLWAVPPKLSKSTSDSLLPDKPTSSLWAVPPKAGQPADSRQKSTLWAVPPQFGAEQLKLHPSVSHRTQQETKRRTVRFQSDDTLKPRSQHDWAERPSVERLYRQIDKYLPEHDLDQEILVEPPVAVSRKIQGHKKSIRHVANEARTNNLVRRQSTKMWHRAVEQVKPGMDVNVQHPEGLPKSKKLQWFRGRLIGKGSFGRVYHAMNMETMEWIAVKQVDLPVTNADYAKPELREMRDALFREISLLEDLDNEFIVQYLGYNLNEEENHIEIFLEYVPGGSIASCLSKTGKFQVALVQFFTRQILLGLAYLHNRNILHRDIKAGNILLDQNGVCKITDFGLSKLSGQDKAYDPHSNNSVMRGTVFWMAPEVVKGTNYNAKVDIWSLGCTVIEMLTGSHPWLELNMLAALYNLGKYQAPPIPEDLPEDATDFLAKCFTIHPEDRPTAKELLEHAFVQSDPNFDFLKHMKKVETEQRSLQEEMINKGN